jgi:hypothetical protein
MPDRGPSQAGENSSARYLLDGDDSMLPLVGRSDPIHAANAAEGLALNAELALDYLRFFVFFLRGSEGPFTLLEAELELLPADGETVTPELEQLRSRIRPMRIGGQDGQGRFLVPATIAYDGTMWRATLAVAPSGEVEMIDEKEPVSLGTARVPECPYLDRPEAAATSVESETPPAAPRPDEPGEPEEGRDETPIPDKPAPLEETVSDRDVTRGRLRAARRCGARARREHAAQALQLADAGGRVDRAARPVRKRLASRHHHRVRYSVHRGHRRGADRARARPQGQAFCRSGESGVRRRLALLSRPERNHRRRYFPISFTSTARWDAEWMAHELATARRC